MNPTRRVASLSLALSLLLLGCSASAAPAGKGLIGTLKSAFAAGAERRAKAQALRAANKEIELFVAQKGDRNMRESLRILKSSVMLSKADRRRAYSLLYLEAPSRFDHASVNRWIKAGAMDLTGKDR